MSKFKESKRAHDYSIAWISALSIEAAAAMAMLDERHNEPSDFVQSLTDENSYAWGRISNHNVVITSLPSYSYGTTNATRMALGLLSSFPQVKFGLLVGIGAGVPESGRDIRLGDVAVSQPSRVHGGLIQYDYGRVKNGTSWELTGTLVRPPNILLSALSRVRSEHELTDNLIPEILSSASQTYPKFARQFSYPGAQYDNLTEEVANNLAAQAEVTRQPRLDERPLIHYGTIASGNMVVKDAATRRSIYNFVGPDCISIEMEAAGLMYDFPCIVVRGICDYADSHKNDIWQRYAAATAAAFAKELLAYVPKLNLERRMLISPAQRSATDDLDLNLIWDKKAENDDIDRLPQKLYTFPYAERKDQIPQRLAGTCEWFTTNSKFESWLYDPMFPLLWVTADPGSGKSVLARYLIDEILPGQDRTVCYFFFKEEFVDQRTAAAAGYALLHQLLRTRLSVLKKASVETLSVCLEDQEISATQLWQVFFSLLSDVPGEWICVFDAIDECIDPDVVFHAVSEAYQSIENKGRLKTIFLSRPFDSLQQQFERLRAGVTVLRLDGENDDIRHQRSLEADVVLKRGLHRLCLAANISQDKEQRLVNRIIEIPHRTYLWTDLVLQSFEQASGFKGDHMLQVLADIPSSLEEVYERILAKSGDPIKTKIILQLIVGAQRPFTLEELATLLVLDGAQNSSNQLLNSIEPKEHFRSTLGELCGPLVVAKDDCVHLLHQTARDFLLSPAISEDSASGTTTTISASPWKGSLTDEGVQKCLAERCLWTITLETTNNIPQSLCEYASTYWSMHLDAAGVDTNDSILDIAMLICSPLERHFDKWFHICMEDYLDRYRWDHNLAFVSVLCALGSDYPLVISGFLGSKVLITRQLKNVRTSYNIISLAFWWSISSAQTEAAYILLSHGASPDETASEALASVHDARAFLSHIGIADQGLLYTPLHLAASTRQTAIVEQLLDLGADVNRVYDFDGKTALHFACQHSDLNIVRVLLRYGASINARDLKGQTALHLACQHPDINVVRILLESGAAVNDGDSKGRTALHLACQHLEVNIVKTLVERGADTTIRDIDGHAPWAVLLNAIPSVSEPGGRCHAILELIYEAGQDWRDKYGNTALHLAVNNGCSRCVELCLKHGVDLEAVNEDGLTPGELSRNCLDRETRDCENGGDRLAWAKEYDMIYGLLLRASKRVY